MSKDIYIYIYIYFGVSFGVKVLKVLNCQVATL